jgi:hypothetical protein
MDGFEHAVPWLRRQRSVAPKTMSGRKSPMDGTVQRWKVYDYFTNAVRVCRCRPAARVTVTAFRSFRVDEWMFRSRARIRLCRE